MLFPEAILVRRIRRSQIRMTILFIKIQLLIVHTIIAFFYELYDI